MKKWTRGFVLGVIFFCLLSVKSSLALDFEINNFESQIRLEKDSSLRITETIETNFFVQKHGIFRIIPYIYNHNGKTIKAKIEVLGIKDDAGNKISYTVENFNQSKRIKIGEANLTIFGRKKYIIDYQIKKVVLDYGEGPEIYWNVTGNEWEVPIQKASAVVESPFGKITRIECFGCTSSFSENKAKFEGKGGLTIVAQIDKSNSILGPSEWQKLVDLVIDNWGYGAAIAPFLIMLIMWFRKGRDRKYLTENVFYRPENEIEKNTPLLNRPHLPLVYSPIDGLTPSEVGTILDEKLDTKDIVAEIMELARLGHFTIKKVESKGLFGIVSRDYELTKTGKGTETLNKFQIELLKALFGVMAKESEVVKVSELKNNFYTHLQGLRSEMYKNLANKKMTDGNLMNVKGGWIAAATGINILAWILVMIFISSTGNSGAIVMIIGGGILSLILANQMPRKTAWGYSLHRQAMGLQYYLSKGKWREEVAEKRLFLEEMLPLAITLGVVDQLARDMKDLGIEPPKYFQGSAINSLAHDLNNFSSSTASSLVTSPSNYSGSGSWSGGSGFGGGGGGGGFGGGGGGSW